MKKLITLDTIFASLFSAIGYGLGFFIPSSYGLNFIFSLIICFIIGLIFDLVISSIVYSKYVQEKDIRRYISFGIIVLIFIFAWWLSIKFLSHSLIGDIVMEYAFVIGIPIISFIISLFIELYKRKKMLEKYGKGDNGYYFKEEEIDEIDFFNDKNKEIIDDYDTSLSVKTKYGTYVGLKRDNQIFFNGIPYAKAPVGDLRFMPPERLRRSDKVFEAYYYGPSEIQPRSDHNILNNYPQSEDCLYLNVITTTLDINAKKPVIVYIHGGDGRYGGCCSPIYDLKNISKNIDAVFVNFNYRTGLFGVVDFRERFNDFSLKDCDSLCIEDMLSCLNYVKENIYLFGGDSNNITLMGDSVGASYIIALCSLKASKNIFKRVFLLTGSTYDFPSNNGNAIKLGNAIVDELNIKTVNDLKTIPSEELRKIYDKYYFLVEPSPRNGRYISENIGRLFKDGVARDIDFIVGFPSEEESGFKGMTVGDVEYDDLVNSYYNFMKEIAKDGYKDLFNNVMSSYKNKSSNDFDAKYNMISDVQFKSSVLSNCSNFFEGGSNVHVFYWNEKSQIEKFKSNTILMITTILGNKMIAEKMGYIISEDVCEIFQSFINKYINNKELILEKNEIDGIGKIVWKKYDHSNNILVIGDDEITNETDIFSKEIKALKEIIDKKV